VKKRRAAEAFTRKRKIRRHHVSCSPPPPRMAITPRGVFLPKTLPPPPPCPTVLRQCRDYRDNIHPYPGFFMQTSITQLILMAPPLLLALTFHEFAHGYVAWRLGDPTAARQGRLSMNPLRHLDPLGTLAFFLIRFGWAKPVPVNASYFRDPKRGMLLVALAGPMSNLLLAVLSAVAIKLVVPLAVSAHGQGLADTVMLPILVMLVNSVWINLVLCIFNLIPVPPLDGGRILAGFLSDRLAYSLHRYEYFGIVLILVLSLTGVLGQIIGPVVRVANSLLLT